MRVLGIDPGGTTGLCLIDGHEVCDYTQVEFEEILSDGHLEDFIDQATHIGIERFFLTARTVTMSRQPEALYVIGIVIYLASRFDIPYRLQSSADAKTAFTNETLRDLGLFKKVKGPHARDALRHALLAERAFA